MDEINRRKLMTQGASLISLPALGPLIVGVGALGASDPAHAWSPSRQVELTPDQYTTLIAHIKTMIADGKTDSLGLKDAKAFFGTYQNSRNGMYKRGTIYAVLRGSSGETVHQRLYSFQYKTQYQETKFGTQKDYLTGWGSDDIVDSGTGLILQKKEYFMASGELRRRLDTHPASRLGYIAAVIKKIQELAAASTTKIIEIKQSSDSLKDFYVLGFAKDTLAVYVDGKIVGAIVIFQAYIFGRWQKWATLDPALYWNIPGAINSYDAGAGLAIGTAGLFGLMEGYGVYNFFGPGWNERMQNDDGGEGQDLHSTVSSIVYYGLYVFAGVAIALASMRMAKSRLETGMLGYYAKFPTKDAEDYAGLYYPDWIIDLGIAKNTISGYNDPVSP